MNVNWVLVGDTFFACCSSRLTFSCPLGVVDERAAAFAIAAEMMPLSVLLLLVLLLLVLLVLLLLSLSPVFIVFISVVSQKQRAERHSPFWS